MAIQPISPLPDLRQHGVQRLTRRRVSPVATSTTDIGTVDEACSQTLPLNFRANNPFSVQSNVTGTASFAIDQTMSDVQSLTNPSNDAIWFKVAALGTVDIISEGSRHVRAMRVVVDTHSAAAEIQTIVFQNEYI